MIGYPFKILHTKLNYWFLDLIRLFDTQFNFYLLKSFPRFVIQKSYKF